MKVEYSPIIDGQYIVKIHLNEFCNELELCGEIKKYTIQNQNIYTFDKGILKYKSETLLPVEIRPDKTKLLLIFGNPATHSISNGMFYFSRTNLCRHSMWGKLAKAKVLQAVISNKEKALDARREEAKIRKKIILSGQASFHYAIGMTTFYSFPTSAAEGVKKVEDLFSPILSELDKYETNRILSYPYTLGAKLIFVQKSSYMAFLANASEKKQETIFWPLRGRGASGAELKEKLQKVYN